MKIKIRLPPPPFNPTEIYRTYALYLCTCGADEELLLSEVGGGFSWVSLCEFGVLLFDVQVNVCGTASRLCMAFEPHRYIAIAGMMAGGRAGGRT